MTGTYKDKKVSIPRNQMFVTFETSSTLEKRGFKASILKNSERVVDPLPLMTYGLKLSLKA